MSKFCSDTCPHCVYIGDGDFICDLYPELVIEDWIPERCIKEDKHDS